jgi:hypothetical protein
MPAMAVFRLVLMVLALALVGACMGVVMFWWTQRPAATAVEPIAVSVGRLRFAIPPAYVRDGALPRPGDQERVDLALRFPEMTPVERSGTGPVLYVALLREDGVVDPSARVTEIYGRFLEPDIWQNPGGLLLRRFAATSPYGDEELFISPPDGGAFSARCRKPQAGGRTGDIGEGCIWRFRIGGADVQVRFAPDLLPQWEAIVSGTRGKVTEWRRP